MVVQQQRLPSRIVRIVMTATLLTAAFIYDTDVVRKIYDKNVVSSNEMKTVQKEKNGLASSKCTCVACNEDKVCGGLFRGNRYPGMPSSKDALRSEIHIVVSHCKKSLDWMPSYLEGFINVKTIHIISKCGQKVVGAPDEATVKVIPNVGRCDHAYAHYITTILPTLVSDENDDSIVVFLKDSIREKVVQRCQGKLLSRTDLEYLVSGASSTNGFACGLRIVAGPCSVYHDTSQLFRFSLNNYDKGTREYTGDGVPFAVGKESLGDFYKALNATSLPGLVQVCYGGIFAASAKNIFKHDMMMWKTMEKFLERGDNIQEGHHAERCWGPLLATPLEPWQMEAARNHTEFSSNQIVSGGQ